MAKKDSKTIPPWYRTKFDLEGLGFGALALALAIIVGGIDYVGGFLSLIFWISFVVILFASRDAERTSPEGAKLVLAPCDGVITDITTVAPPREVRWDTPEVLRIRLSTAPFSVNGIRSPLTGNVESFVEEAGAPSSISLDPDNSDLREAYLLVSGEDGVVGMRLVTGGLGPRLDIDLETGDAVRAGRKIGVRRLGGWCDVYLPLGSPVSLLVGMSVIGGETIMTSLDNVVSDYVAAEPETEESVTPEVIPEVVVEEIAPPVEETAPLESTEVVEEPTVAETDPEDKTKA